VSSDPDEVRFLDDVRVLEIASLAPAMLGMHLADLGAEVIKIEPPGRGDATRLVGRRPGFDDSGLHRRWNRGKKSVAVDTSTLEGQAILRRMIPHVDIVVEGLRPGALAKMGLSREELVALRPDVVVVALSGYGQTGPYRDLPGHGVGFDAIAGLARVESNALGRPRVASQHVYHGPLVAPMLGASAVLAALSWSRRTGRPAFLDLAQADAAAFANYEIEEQLSAARAAPGTAGAAGAGRSTTQAYRTRDDKVLLVMAMERKFLARLADVVGRADLLDDVPEHEHIARGNDRIDGALVEILASKDLDEWMHLFAAADVPVVPAHDSATALEDPQLRSRLEWMEAAQGTVTMKTPVHSEPPLASPDRAPSVGRDTADVLVGMGLEPAELERLAGNGIIRLAPASGPNDNEEERHGEATG
jgi:crotonobetainyl-CoA:carnitine CoA-transferase CaiB-like acyl-CoA transferase